MKSIERQIFMPESTATDLARPADFPAEIALPPADLWSDEPPMESDRHRKQMDLLIRSLESGWQSRQDFYATGNLTIYFSPHQSKSEDFRGPDFFVVLGTERRDRRSWIVWHEDGKYPNVIVELLSASTAAIDRGLKKQIYQDTFRTPDYFWFDPEGTEFRGFHLVDGRYEELSPDERGRFWSRQLELYLGVYEGWLRFFTPDGQLVLLAEEQEKQRADQEGQRADAAQRRAEQLASYLRSQGVDPDQI
nr:Uma2 family endonuclease [Gloeobacter morelensis]